MSNLAANGSSGSNSGGNRPASDGNSAIIQAFLNFLNLNNYSIQVTGNSRAEGDKLSKTNEQGRVAANPMPIQKPSAPLTDCDESQTPGRFSGNPKKKKRKSKKSKKSAMNAPITDPKKSKKATAEQVDSGKAAGEAMNHLPGNHAKSDLNNLGNGAQMNGWPRPLAATTTTASEMPKDINQRTDQLKLIFENKIRPAFMETNKETVQTVNKGNSDVLNGEPRDSFRPGTFFDLHILNHFLLRLSEDPASPLSLLSLRHCPAVSNPDSVFAHNFKNLSFCKSCKINSFCNKCNNCLYCIKNIYKNCSNIFNKFPPAMSGNGKGNSGTRSYSQAVNNSTEVNYGSINNITNADNAPVKNNTIPAQPGNIDNSKMPVANKPYIWKAAMSAKDGNGDRTALPGYSLNISYKVEKENLKNLKAKLDSHLNFANNLTISYKVCKKVKNKNKIRDPDLTTKTSNNSVINKTAESTTVNKNPGNNEKELLSENTHITDKTKPMESDSFVKNISNKSKKSRKINEADPNKTDTKNKEEITKNLENMIGNSNKIIKKKQELIDIKLNELKDIDDVHIETDDSTTSDSDDSADVNMKKLNKRASENTDKMAENVKKNILENSRTLHNHPNGVDNAIAQLNSNSDKYELEKLNRILYGKSEETNFDTDDEILLNNLTLNFEIEERNESKFPEDSNFNFRLIRNKLMGELCPILRTKINELEYNFFDYGFIISKYLDAENRIFCNRPINESIDLIIDGNSIDKLEINENIDITNKNIVIGSNSVSNIESNKILNFNENHGNDNCDNTNDSKVAMETENSKILEHGKITIEGNITTIMDNISNLTEILISTNNNIIGLNQANSDNIKYQPNQNISKTVNEVIELSDESNSTFMSVKSLPQDILPLNTDDFNAPITNCSTPQIIKNEDDNNLTPINTNDWIDNFTLTNDLSDIHPENISQYMPTNGTETYNDNLISEIYRKLPVDLDDNGNTVNNKTINNDLDSNKSSTKNIKSEDEILENIAKFNMINHRSFCESINKSTFSPSDLNIEIVNTNITVNSINSSSIYLNSIKSNSIKSCINPKINDEEISDVANNNNFYNNLIQIPLNPKDDNKSDLEWSDTEPDTDRDLEHDISDSESIKSNEAINNSGRNLNVSAINFFGGSDGLANNIIYRCIDNVELRCNACDHSYRKPFHHQTLAIHYKRKHRVTIDSRIHKILCFCGLEFQTSKIKDHMSTHSGPQNRNIDEMKDLPLSQMDIDSN